MSDIITVHFQHHTTDATLTLELPRNTVIDTLTPHLYEAGFIAVSYTHLTLPTN